MEMQNLGASLVNVGKSKEEILRIRTLRGECLSCGRKSYTKTALKTTPLAIPNMVEMDGV